MTFGKLLRRFVIIAAFVLLGSGCAEEKKTTGAKEKVAQRAEGTANEQAEKPSAARSSEVGAFKPEDTVWVLDNFEHANRWTVEPWANPAELSIVEGELKIALKGGDHDKAAISTPTRLNLADRNTLCLDVTNNMQKPIRIAVALLCGQPPVYFESTQVEIKSGKNKDVSFDLRSAKFKSEATQWKYGAQLIGKERVSRIYILFYTKESGEIRIDNVRFAK